MRNPRDKYNLQSLEEDFKNIGILEEDDTSEEVEVVEDEDAELELSSEEEDDLEEGKRRAAGGKKMVRTKRMKSGDKAKARQSYRRRKSKIKKARKKRGRSARGKKLARLAKRLAAKESVELTNSDRINSILEDVQDIVSSVNAPEVTEDTQALENAIKSFANVAIISEMLSDFFAEAVELVEEDQELSEELADAAHYFQEQAEAAAYLATSLDEGSDLDEDLDVDELFQEQMNSLVDGLEFYADLTEDDEDGEGEEVLEMDDDEDEDDEGNDKKGKKEMPAFLKKKLGKK